MLRAAPTEYAKIEKPLTDAEVAGLGVNRIEIEELVLHGFGRSDGAAIAESIELALRSRLAGAGSRFGELSAGASPRAIGGAVAERLHGSVQT